MLFSGSPVYLLVSKIEFLGLPAQILNKLLEYPYSSPESDVTTTTALDAATESTSSMDVAVRILLAVGLNSKGSCRPPLSLLS